MKTRALILLAFFVVAVLAGRTRRAPGLQPAWASQLRGWHKIFGFIALAAAVVIMLNPEFLALGLVGDAAFFDVLVLLLSLQLKSFVFHAWSSLQSLYEHVAPRSCARLRMTPAMVLLIFMPVVDLTLTIRKTAHEIFS